MSFISSQNTSKTEFQSCNHIFRWNVHILNSRHECIRFSNPGSPNVEITIKIPEDDIKICILVEKRSSASQFVLCNFMLLDVEGKERDSRRATHMFKNAEIWEFPTFVKKSQLYAEGDVYIKDDCFSLQCDITVSDEGLVKDKIKRQISSLSGRLNVSGIETFVILNEDLKRMYDDKIHTDIKLKAGKEEFPAHKSILCARSPVFLAMFNNDMTESLKGEVDIPDLDAKTVGLFLEYIYTGAVYDLDYENTMKLIVAADKYEIVSLVDKCAELIASMLCDANVCEILVTADLVQHDTLKYSAFEYIKKQPDKIFNSNEWKHCVRNNLELATETVCEVSRLWGDQTKGNSEFSATSFYSSGAASQVNSSFAFPSYIMSTSPSFTFGSHITPVSPIQITETLSVSSGVQKIGKAVRRLK